MANGAGFAVSGAGGGSSPLLQSWEGDRCLSRPRSSNATSASVHGIQGRLCWNTDMTTWSVLLATAERPQVAQSQKVTAQRHFQVGCKPRRAALAAARGGPEFEFKKWVNNPTRALSAEYAFWVGQDLPEPFASALRRCAATCQGFRTQALYGLRGEQYNYRPVGLRT